MLVFDIIEKEIRSEFESIISKVTERMNQLLNKLNKMKQNYIREEEARMTQVKELENIIEELRDLSIRDNYISNIKKDHITSTKEQLRKYEWQTPCPVPVFKKEGIQSSLLQLEWIGTIEDAAALYSERNNPIRTVGELGSKKGQLNGPAGICVDTEGKLYVCDQLNSRIQVFSKENNFLTAFGKEHFSKPQAIELYDKWAFVSDCGSNLIFKLQQSDHKLVKKSVKGVLNNPCGLTVDRSNKEILVADSNNHRIAVFNSDLILLREIGKGKLESPLDVKIHLNRIFVAAKSDSYSVHVFSRSGEFLNRIIDLRGGISDMFFCFDKSDNIVISDGNSQSLQVYTKCGELLHSIQCEGETAGVAVTNDNTIICAMFNAHSIQFF